MVRSLLLLVLLLPALVLGWANGAPAQPADCPAAPAMGPSLSVGIDLAGRPGVPTGTTGKAYVAVPMQGQVADCGEPAPPADVLHGEPGDLLRGGTAHVDSTQ
jgi:hypothetical protein